MIIIQYEDYYTHQCRQAYYYPSAYRKFVGMKKTYNRYQDTGNKLKKIKMIKNTQFAFFNGIHISRNPNIFDPA